MNWVRGKSLGNGSFSTVNEAIHNNPSVNFPSHTAVKSTDLHDSHLLINEEQILNRLQTCPHIIKCFGHDQTFENGEEYYNVFLEYASKGTLADHIKNHGGKLPENLVRTYTKSILEGLKYIHEKGFVHCDIKQQNILVFDNDDDVKIADFGLAKEKGKKHSDKLECRGTPIFMSPESVNDNEYESPVDIWALGCTVVEIVTGKPAWDANGSNIWRLMIRIGVGDEVPKIPDELSEQGKDFLRKCFVKEPLKRWSAEMLLNHPFIADDTVLLEKKVNESLPSSSPRTHFDFPQWASSTVITLSSPFSPGSVEWRDRNCVSNLSLPVERLRRLVTDEVTMNWSEERWSIVRSLVDHNV